MVSTRGVRYKFSEGERVLCYEPDPTKAKVLYDSKVLEVVESKDKRGRRIVEYLIHFQGWNSSWDRCVSEDFVLKDTEENRQLQRDLAEKSQLQLGAYLYRRERKKGSTSSAGAGPAKRSRQGFSDDGSSSSTQPDEGEGSGAGAGDTGDTDSSSGSRRQHAAIGRAHITLPPALRDRLTFDYHLVVKRGRVSRVPAVPCAAQILEAFVKWFARAGAWHQPRPRPAQDPPNKPDLLDVSCRLNLVREVADGLRVYFDFILRGHLLYKQEYAQYHEICGQFIDDREKSIKQELEDDEHMSQDEGDYAEGHSPGQDIKSNSIPEYAHLPPDPERLDDCKPLEIFNGIVIKQEIKEEPLDPEDDELHEEIVLQHELKEEASEEYYQGEENMEYDQMEYENQGDYNQERNEEYDEQYEGQYEDHDENVQEYEHQESETVEYENQQDNEENNEGEDLNQPQQIQEQHPEPTTEIEHNENKENPTENIEQTKPKAKEEVKVHAKDDNMRKTRSEEAKQRAKEEENRLRKAKEEEIRQQQVKEEEIRTQKAKEEESRIKKAKEEELRLQKAKVEELRQQKAKEEELRLQKAKEEEIRLQKAKEEEILLQKAKEDDTTLQKIKEVQTRLQKSREEQSKLLKSKEDKRKVHKAKDEEFKQQKARDEPKLKRQEDKAEKSKSKESKVQKEVNVENVNDATGPVLKDDCASEKSSDKSISEENGNNHKSKAQKCAEEKQKESKIEASEDLNKEENIENKSSEKTKGDEKEKHAEKKQCEEKISNKKQKDKKKGDKKEDKPKITQKEIKEDIKVPIKIEIKQEREEEQRDSLEECHDVTSEVRRPLTRRGNVARRLRSHKSAVSQSENEEPLPSTSMAEPRTFEAVPSSVCSSGSSLSEGWSRAPPPAAHPPSRTPLSLLLDKVAKWQIIPREGTEHLPSRVYGAIHLARLFVKLPDFLNATQMPDFKLKLIVKHIDMFVQFLDEHSEWFGESYYFADSTSRST